MPTTETINVARDDVIDLLAALDAAAQMFHELQGADSPLDDLFGDTCWNLKVKLLGGGPNPATPGEPWDTEPDVVEIYARSAQLQADALSRLTCSDRIGVLRALAARYREHGTIDLPVPA